MRNWGSVNSAAQAAARFDDAAVTIIDSGTASVGHMLQVIAAAEDAALPEATADVVATAARVRAGGGYGYAMVDTMEYLQKGGRIGKAQAFMGSLLKVKPILKVANGEVLPVTVPATCVAACSDLRAWYANRARLPNWPLSTPPTPPRRRRCGIGCPTWPPRQTPTPCRLVPPSAPTWVRARWRCPHCPDAFGLPAAWYGGAQPVRDFAGGRHPIRRGRWNIGDACWRRPRRRGGWRDHCRSGCRR